MVKEFFKSLWEKIPIETRAQQDSFQCPNCRSELSPEDFGFDEQKLKQESSVEESDKNSGTWDGPVCPECGEQMNITEYDYNFLD